MFVVIVSSAGFLGFCCLSGTCSASAVTYVLPLRGSHSKENRKAGTNMGLMLVWSTAVYVQFLHKVVDRFLILIEYKYCLRKGIMLEENSSFMLLWLHLTVLQLTPRCKSSQCVNLMKRSNKDNILSLSYQAHGKVLKNCESIIKPHFKSRLVITSLQRRQLEKAVFCQWLTAEDKAEKTW